MARKRDEKKRLEVGDIVWFAGSPSIVIGIEFHRWAEENYASVLHFTEIEVIQFELFPEDKNYCIYVQAEKDLEPYDGYSR